MLLAFPGVVVQQMFSNGEIKDCKLDADSAGLSGVFPGSTAANDVEINGLLRQLWFANLLVIENKPPFTCSQLLLGPLLQWSGVSQLRLGQSCSEGYGVR